VPVPENFDSSRKRREREELANQIAEQRRAGEQNMLQLEVAFAEYRRAEIETYIASHLTPDEHAAMIEDHKRSYVAQFRNAANWPAETLHSIAVNAAAVEISRRAPIFTFDEFCKKYDS
jgi:hypothetical protein